MSELSSSELATNATSALKRSQAGQRIAEADKRYASLAEALTIIADAAQILNERKENAETYVDWDLVKLAQAAASDQCALLLRTA